MSIDLEKVGQGVAEALEAEAAKRGHTITSLIRQILRCAIATDFAGVA